MTNGVPYSPFRGREWFALSPEANRARLAERHRRIRLTYARRMGKRLATITKHGDALIDVVLAKTLLRQFGVEEQFFADAIVAGRQARTKLAAAA